MDSRSDPEATLVSRRHARLLRVGDGADVEDVGSTNGTTLNGRPVHLAHLSDGDEIRIGEVRLRYRAGGVSGAGGTAVPGEDAETPPDCTADPGPPPSPPPLPSSQGGQP